MIIRKAIFDDVEEIYALINDYASRKVMLGRSRVDLHEKLRDFYVAEVDSEEEKNLLRSGESILGCSALHLSWSNTAEIRSMAVRTEAQGRTVGANLVDACLDEAKGLGLRQVFLFTYVEKFFVKFGFQVVDKNTLPQKVFTDCVGCPFIDNCNETAMTLDLPLQTVASK